MLNQPPPTVPESGRILVRGVNWLGDAVMTTPALQRLRERFPQAHITLLTNTRLAELWAQHPSLDKVLSFSPGESIWSITRRLRAERFDLCLILPNSPRSALAPWLAGIPHRIGYARPWRNWFLTWAVPPPRGYYRMHKRSKREVHRLIQSGSRKVQPTNDSPLPGSVPPQAHQVHEYLHLVAVLGASADPLPTRLELLPEEIKTTALKFGLADQLDAKRLTFGLNPGAEYGPAKCWPIERFAAAAAELRKRTDCTWLIFGMERDLPAAGRIESALQGLGRDDKPGQAPALCYNLCGKTSLRELMALLGLCRAFLSNDSGPMHVAAALSVPVVVPFGSTSPALTAPGLPGDSRHHLLSAEVPCSPCFRRTCPIDLRCMTGISVDAVVAATLEASFQT